MASINSSFRSNLLYIRFYYNHIKFKNRLYNLFIKQFQLKLNPIKVVDYLLESFENDPKETLSTLLTLKRFY